jgi:hypothetical protein
MQPLRAIGHPDSDMVPMSNSYSNETFGHFFDIVCELAMGPTLSFEHECKIVFP